MLNTIKETLKRILEEETLEQRGHRMIPAALYGALIASAYILTTSFINVYTFPNLPIGVDWPRVLGMWAGYAFGFALFGAVAAWFTDDAAGSVGGGVIMTILLGVAFLLTMRSWSSASVFQSILMAVTLVGVDMLGAWGLRWTANRHLTILHESDAGQRRKNMTRHILIVLLIGLAPGALGRMDRNAEDTLDQMHELLQAAPTDPSVWTRLPIRAVPALENHFGVEYKIYPRWSALTAGSLDVTVRFEDGFTMYCLLPVSAGINFITQCNEGEQVTAGP